MKKNLLLFFCLSMVFYSKAQTSNLNLITGSLVDSVQNQALSYATITLLNSKTSQPTKTTLSTEVGNFEFLVSDTSVYKLEISAIGYNNKTIDINIKNYNLGKILLVPAVKLLGEVVVTAAKAIITKEVDRIGYNVQTDPENKILTVLDMLRKVPMVSVDGSDNIKLKSTGNYKILINGKPSALIAKNPGDVFKSMPASNIQKIEVITVPPAKYDAEGLAGIINIITKKNIDQGYNGSLNTRYDIINGAGVNLNATLKKGKFSLGGFVGYRKQNDLSTNFGNSNIVIMPVKSSLLQKGIRTANNDNYYSTAELSYELDSLNLFTANFLNYSGNNIDFTKQFSTELNGDNTLAHYFELQNKSLASYNGIDFGLDYQHTFKCNKEQLLTTSYKFNLSNDIQNNDAGFFNNNNINNPKQLSPNFKQFNKSGTKEHTLQLDFVLPLKVLTTEMGAKAILRNNFSDFENFNQNLGDANYTLDLLQSNQLSYLQNVYSAYNSYQIKLKKWVAKTGLRLEQTTVKANFSNIPLNQNYINLVPSISIQRKQNDFNSYTLGFTQRIERPGIWQLNPFINKTNPKFVNAGNPSLQPVTSNTFELAYSNFKKGSINVALNYSFANNTVENVLSVGADTVTTNSFANVGKNKRLGLDISTNYPITQKLTVDINAQLLHVNLSGTFDGQFYNNKGLQGHIFTNTSYKFNKGFNASTNIGYDSRYVLLQGRDNQYFYYSFSGSKEILNKKGTLSINLNNPFNKFRTLDFFNSSPNFTQRNFNMMYAYGFQIGFNYKFGKLNGAVKKKERGINNDDVSRGRN